ncbi:MAG: hypothetical protein GX905_03880 [Bacteroidales bacterium]|nr:hypothetical protein [Bacteroidales bacterium]
MIEYRTQRQVINDPPERKSKSVGRQITVPDMGYSIKEIIQRFSSGSPLAIGRQMKYYADTIVSRPIDPTELNDIIQKTKITLMEEKQKKLLEQKQRDDEQFNKKLQEALKKELEKRNIKDIPPKEEKLNS